MENNLIHYKKYITNFHDQEIKYSDDNPCDDKLYSMDSMGHMHLNLIPGILRLSSKKFKTTSTNGYIMKEFDPIFGLLPTFMVKTNKIKDNIDKYVIVRLMVNNEQKSIIGTIEKYIGDVGDIEIEKDLCKIISTCHWSRKIDKMDSGSGNQREILGLSDYDLTPDRLDMTSKVHMSPFNQMITVSVDPLGSKDIDDAISIEIKSDLDVVIGIHIADPTSYIIEDSILDKEVAKRCESIYLNNEHIHMFPHKLSTSIFSLNENKQNRAFSVIIELKYQNMKWEIMTKKINKTIIRIDKNMTYEQFDLEHKNDIRLKIMYEIGKTLYKTILKPSVLTDNINKDDIYDFESKKMIEIFMVIANNFVAEKMIEMSDPIHLSNIIIRAQKPTNQKNINIYTHNVDPKLVEMHDQLRRNGGELRIYNALNQESNNHSSLNLNIYTHFTSPIRRYSDILVHRLLYNLITRNQVFKLTIDYLHQLFLMNHNKKFYKMIYQLERDIMITHHVLNILPDPWDRIWHANGIIIDICNNKIIVKCRGINDTQNDNSVSQYLINTLHTLLIKDQDLDGMKLELFQTIDFKVCFLSKDIRKIRSYV